MTILELQGKTIFFHDGVESVPDHFKELGNVFFEILIRILVEGQLPERPVLHISIDDDGMIDIIKTKTIHLLPIILPHDPLIGKHPLDEFGELEPKSNRFADGKVAISTIPPRIHDDTIIMLLEERIESAFIIHGEFGGLAIHHTFFHTTGI